MKFKVSMSDYITDTKIVKYVKATNVFDAIDKASTLIDHPNDTYLIEAIPITGED